MISAIQRHPSRFVPLAFASALLLVGCGSADGAGDDTAGDTVPAATDSTADGLQAPRPVRTAGGSTMSASAEAAPAADGRMTTDMLMPYRIVTFVPGDLSGLPTNDVGYLFEGGATTTAVQVAALAAGLGVEGEPTRTDDGYSVYWRVGPDDGTAPSIFVSEDAQLSWSYNSEWATQSVSTGCAVADPGVAIEPSTGEGAVGDVADVAATAVAATSAPVEQSCIEQEPPANVPTAEDAEVRARSLMTAVGLDPASFTFEPYADEWFASVSAVEQLDGSFAGRRFDAGFGAEGALQYASGQLAQPIRVGPYPLVDLDVAIARLNDTSGFYGGGWGGMLGTARDVPMTDVAVAAEPAPAEGSGSAGSSGEIAAPVESLPPASVPAPEEVTVTLVDVEADVWWAYDVDGSVWLLPAYRFIGDDGGWYVVPAVTDEFLVQVAAEELPVPDSVPVPEPMPVESIEPMPADTKPETVPTESIPGEPALFDTVPLEPSVGTTLAEFTADAEALGATVRVAEVDGVPQPLTMDFNTNRVNVAVTGEGDAAIVTAILNVG